MPPWTHLHPAVVHVPIALLLFAPLLVLLGLGLRAQRQGLHLAALAALGVGELGALLALATGNAASGLAQRTPELRLALAAHAHYAQLATLLFLGLTVLAAVLFGLRLSAETRVWAHLLWLLLALVAMAALVKTGQLGGQMVHELGTHALSREIP